MDEPFAAVDAATERAIVAVLKDMQQQGKTVVVVHHDLATVPRYFDHVLLLNLRVVAQGPVGAVFNEANLHKTYGGHLPLLEQAASAAQQIA
jgi:manganese/zinc/iron transport system ATP- binding protein